MLHKLRQACRERQKYFDPEGKITPAYSGNELAGETGEACNVLKKLERDRLSLKGSRSNVQALADELADVIICVELVAAHYGIKMEEAVVKKFNESSDKLGIPVVL